MSLKQNDLSLRQGKMPPPSPLPAEPSPIGSKWPSDLTEADLKSMYQEMVLTREYDDRALKLQRQGRIGFYAGTRGEEATQIGTAYATQSQDWIFASYRQPGVALHRGMPLQMLINNLFGNADDITLGRQMPIHYSSRQHHFVSVSSVIGTQIIQGVGAAMAARIKKHNSVTLTYFGDGSTSSNDFHSGMNFAAVHKAPCIFVLVNNQYAISLPVSRQTAVEVLADKAKAYGMPGIQVDGNDVLAIYQATREAADRARRGEGPTLLELKTYRFGPHSSSDDPTRYREKAESDYWLTRDPITTFREKLMGWGIWSDAEETALMESVQAQLAEVVKVAESAPQPAWDTLFKDVYAEQPIGLRWQQDDIMAHESGLALTNEGEFPL